MFGEDKSPVQVDGVSRSNKRTQLIDCRKKSTHAINAILENIQIAEKSLSYAQKDLAISVLKEHNLFKMLTLKEIEEIVEHMKSATVEFGA